MFKRLSGVIDRALVRWGVVANDEQSAMYDRIDRRLDELAAESRARGITTWAELNSRSQHDAGPITRRHASRAAAAKE